MRFFRTILSALTVVALAACGGGSGGGAVLPGGTDPGTRGAGGSTVAFQKDTLWVAYETSVHAFSTDSNGPVTPLKSLGSFPWNGNRAFGIPGIVDIAVAPDGTQWELENRDFAEGGRGWRLNAVAPGAATLPENTDGDDNSYPFAFALAGDGVMVGYNNGSDVIATYPYGASNAQPLRTFTGTSRIYGFASGNDGHLYVARPTGFEVYDPTSTGCCPIRTITTNAPTTMGSSGGFAVGPENSIYVVDVSAGYQSHVMYVNVFPPGSLTVGRRIGPLPTNYDALGHAPRITVDALNRLYVATNGQLYRFGAGADGAATPERVMTDSEIGNPTALAIGPKL